MTSGETLIQAVSAAGVAWVIYYGIYAVYNLFFSPLATFPGPKIAAISRLPVVISHINGRLYKYLFDLHQNYGPIVRIAPEELTIIAPEAWNDLYAQRPHLPKDPYSQTPPLNGADSLFTASGATHARMRRTFANGFSDKALRDQSQLIETSVDRFLLRLRQEIQKEPNATDLAKLYGYLTLDVIGELALGESFHSLEQDGENQWVRGFWLGAKFGSVRTILSRYYPLDLVFGSVFLSMTAKVRAYNWRFTTDSLTRRLQLGVLGSSRSDLISPVIGKITEDKQSGITRNELVTNALAFVIAGCELPTVALAASTYFLLRYPSTMARLKDEVRTSFSSSEEITVNSTQGLEYLVAVIHETLRIHHPTPSHLPRVIPPGGMNVAGTWIPGGTVIGIASQAIHNSPTLWTEPEVFHPERFLPADDPRYDNQFVDDRKEAFKPFSVGPRNCIGGKIFLAEARVTLARLIWNFDLELVDANDWRWPEQKAYLVFEPKPLWIRLTAREFDL